MLFSCILGYLLMSMFLLNLYQCYFVYCSLVSFLGLLLGYIFVVDFGSLNTLYLYFDKMAVLLVLLSYLVIFMVYLCCYSGKDSLLMYFFMNFMLFSLCFCFFSCNLICLYIFFEFSLFPLFLMIVFGGFSMERFQACIYLLIYTLVSSFMFLLLLSFIKVYNIFYMELKMCSFLLEKGVLWAVLFFIFLVKLPVYMLHSWLSKAHVEAPVGGSMILAGILLKLGGFGFYRVVSYISVVSVINLLNFMVIFGVMGAIYSCFICFRQVDIKLLIAYSSVSHMGILLGGMFTMTKMGFCGVVGLMLAHGFCSSVLFFVANMFYVRSGSRNMITMKGLAQYFPVLSGFWLLFCLSNMGTPPSFNFLCEILLLVVIFKKSIILLFLSFFYLFGVVYYNLVLFLRVGHGQSWHFNFMKIESFMEMLVIFFHLVLIFYYLMNTNLFFIF